MIIGIDIGGTHSDGVLISGNEIVKKEKIITDEADIQSTLISLIQKLTIDIESSKIKKISLSTTLVTNLLSKRQESLSGLFLIPGLGAPVSLATEGIKDYFVASGGYVDHRGVAVRGLKKEELEKAKSEFRQKGIRSVAVCSKFSTRNNELEVQAGDYFTQNGFHAFISSDYSGKLNFPRRAFTSFLTASIYPAYMDAAAGIREGVRSMGLKCPIYILKADGGAVPLEESMKCPLESVLSGPAASIMGALYSKEILENEETVVLDIGGTTTDLGFFIGGAPLLEPEGIKIREFNTLIRALRVFPLPIGGDTLFSFEGGRVNLNNRRKGLPYSFGGPQPTLTDVFLASDDKNQKAAEGVAQLIGNNDLNEKLTQVGERAAGFIYEETRKKIEEINSRPIYTVNEFFERHQFSPTKILLAGGAAPFFKASLEKAFGLPVVLAEHFNACNAIGAALAQITAEINLFANTMDGRVSIPETKYFDETPDGFNLDAAKKMALQKLREFAVAKGASIDTELEITESSSFNMVRGFNTSGKNIRVKAQVKPKLNVHE